MLETALLGLEGVPPQGRLLLPPDLDRRRQPADHDRVGDQLGGIHTVSYTHLDVYKRQALPWHPVPSEFIPGMTAQGGAVLGVEHAVLFRRYEL